MPNRALRVVKEIVRGTALEAKLRYWREERRLAQWQASERESAPPHLWKVKTLRDYAYRAGLDVLVETGTYRGDTIFALRNDFRRLITIELSEVLFKAASRRFRHYPHITVLRGDSGRLLSEVLAQIVEPCLFWLDAHYSADITARGETDTPIVRELGEIANHPVRGHVVLIDDARCFNGTNDYPTLAELSNLISNLRAEWALEVRDDIIRVHSPLNA